MTRLLRMWHDADPDLKKRIIVLLLIVAVLAAGYSSIRGNAAALVKKREAKEKSLTELLSLKEKFSAAKRQADVAANRRLSGGISDSPAKFVEETGIRGKGVQIKPTRIGEEDGAEIRIDGLTANEVVNLLWRIEKESPFPGIRRGSFRTRFDDPARIDVSLTVAMPVKTAPGGK